ncbi:MAG: polyprenyl synthetase family protein [Bacteroidaceae bacterium]|nr:polyprenyl synthetase family protein [Bacteroidaceae bacterium]
MDALQLIRKPIEAEMQEYLKFFDLCMQSDNKLLHEVLKVVSSRMGKMMRPILTLLSAKLLGEVNTNTYTTAAAFELLHTATLIHDDVVDESDERRGQSSVNKLYDNKISVLVGDFILALSLQNVSKINSPQLMKIVAETSQKLASGELLQLKSVHNQEISEDIYFRIIQQKTAVLFSACAQAGAMSVSADESVIETLRKFGEIVGICFQIRDDIFDYSDSQSIGKPTGNDMKEGKLTLPVIYALKSTGDEAMLRIAKAVKNLNATHAEIAELVAFAKAQGGIEYAHNKMVEYAEKAKGLLDCFSDSEVKQALLQYVDFVTDRKV